MTSVAFARASRAAEPAVTRHTDEGAAALEREASHQAPGRRGGAIDLNQRVALISVGVPTIGAAGALALACTRGVSGLDLGLLISMYVLTTLGVEAGLHRFFSHRAFRAGPLITSMLGILGSMAAQGPILFWVAIHRKHHAHTDRDGDPHSPHLHGKGLGNRLRGFLHAHVGWLFQVEDVPWARYAPDLLRDRLIFTLTRLYPLWVLSGLLLPGLVGLVWTRTWSGAGTAVLFGGLLRIFLLDQVTWAINSLGHLVGARPHKARGEGRNLAALALLSMGGSWHNNHHAFPGSARTDRAPWQIDLSGQFIELLAALGLASDVQRASRKGPPRRGGERTQPVLAEAGQEL